MRKSRFTEAQIMGVLRQAEGGIPVPGLGREDGIGSATLCRWRARYGGMDASMMSGNVPPDVELRGVKGGVALPEP